MRRRSILATGNRRERPGPANRLLPEAPPISLFAFRQRHSGASPEEEDRLNRLLLERINQARRVYLTGTELVGRFFIRVCVLHFRTHAERIDEALEIITRCLAELRSSS